jgi:hypothetical protein
MEDAAEGDEEASEAVRSYRKAKTTVVYRDNKELSERRS